MKIANKMLKNSLFFLIFCVVFAMPLMAQDAGGEPAAILVYADDEFEVEVYDVDSNPVEAYIGMELLEGDSIRTNNTTVELQLEPNGSILKLSESTALRVEGFQRDVNSSNDFALLGGKLRAVAARTVKNSNNYSVFTQSAVAAVRGTDFIIGSEGKLVVGEGAVDFIKSATGETLSVTSGMVADILGDTFSALALTAEQLAEEFQSFEFTALSPAVVPGHSTNEEVAEEEEEVVEEEEEEETVQADATPLPVVPEETEEKTVVESSSEPSALEKFLAPIGEFLGMEIGSITLDGKTWSKMVFQPEFAIGELQTALYLPFIYETNVFDSNDWYKPAGNDEWSFGTDTKYRGDILAIASDIMGDLFLKIKYVKWGQQRDPFYLKFGNLNDMTLGHGILMSNFANDADFPAVRKAGLNVGFSTEKLVLEFVADDLARPQVFGTRVGFKPGGGIFTLGVSAVTDINPDVAVEMDSNGDNPYGEYIFINPAFDFDVSIIENDILSIVLFGDVASMLPLKDGTPQTAYIYNGNGGSFLNNIQNYGAASGLFGNVLFIDYRLEYRFSKGQFRPGFYNSTYDRLKGLTVAEIDNYLNLATLPVGEINQGIYGNVSANIMDMAFLSGGYLWPWEADGSFDPSQDYFHLKLSIEPGVIPVIGIYGSVSYDRTGLVQSIMDGGFQLIDGSTVFKGEVVYPFAPTMDIALLVASAVSRDADGNVIYVSGKPEVYNSFTVETRVSF